MGPMGLEEEVNVSGAARIFQGYADVALSIE
jgi:hypothetical protein